MIYQHPLAYLLGLEGLALLRAWAGDFDEDFVRERLAEVRRLLDDRTWAEHAGVAVRRGDSQTGYQQWASSYDEPNTLFAIDEPVVREILDGLPVGTALDAACGTGRLASLLASTGHQVIGVDSSPDMLAVAAARMPEAALRLGELTAMPVDDRSVDTVVCGLALSHVAELGPVFAEFARVLRPGGHLVISDTHHELVFRGSVVKALGPAGEPGLVATHRHSTGDYLRAALSHGLDVRRCEEPRMPPTDRRVADTDPETPPVTTAGEWNDWPWSLLGVVPEAARAAWSVTPVIVWHFQRAT